MSMKTASPESVGINPTRLERISKVMNEVTESDALSGISTMVARRGKIVHFEQFGYKDREAKEPMKQDTLFRIYSMTKPIICTALMTLYEQGKFDLLDPVSKFIPAFANLKVLERNELGEEKLIDLQQPVLISHLFTHTSGLAYDCYERFSVCGLYRQQAICANANRSLEEFVDAVCQFPLAFQPGTQWFYSVSIDIIARLIEIIADMPLIDYLNKVLFKPLNMLDTSYFVLEAKRHRIATMYGGADFCGPNMTWTKFMDAWNQGANEPLDVSQTDPADNQNYLRGGYGLKSTAQDYMAFAQMLLNKGEYNGQRILGRRTIDFMHTNHLASKLLPIGFEDIVLPGLGFGLGSRVALDPAQIGLMTSEGEFGWSGAGKTYYWVDPKEELVGVFFTQSMMNFSMIDRAFQTLVYQALE